MDEEFAAKMRRLRSSANVIFYKYTLFDALKKHTDAFYWCFANDHFSRFVLEATTSVFDDSPQLEGVDKLKRIKTHYRLNTKKELRAIIFEIPEPVLEPECNFVAVCFCPAGNVEQLYYYTSELYGDGTFGLCELKSGGGHFSYASSCKDIQTIDQFWQAIERRHPSMDDPGSILAWHNGQEGEVPSLVQFRVGNAKSIEAYLGEYEEEPVPLKGDNNIDYLMLRSKEGPGFLLFRQGEDGFMSAELEDQPIAGELDKDLRAAAA